MDKIEFKNGSIANIDKPDSEVVKSAIKYIDIERIDFNPDKDSEVYLIRYDRYSDARRSIEGLVNYIRKNFPPGIRIAAIPKDIDIEKITLSKEMLS